MNCFFVQGVRYAKSVHSCFNIPLDNIKLCIVYEMVVVT